MLKLAPSLNNSKSKLPKEEYKLSQHVDPRPTPKPKSTSSTINNAYVEKVVKTKPTVKTFKEKVNSINNILSKEIDQIAAEKSRKVPKAPVDNSPAFREASPLKNSVPMSNAVPLNNGAPGSNTTPVNNYAPANDAAPSYNVPTYTSTVKKKKTPSEQWESFNFGE